MPAASRRSWFFWCALGLGLLLGGLHVYALAMGLRHDGRAVELGWNAAGQAGQVRVRAVDERGPAYGRLRPGDRLLSIAGDARLSTRGLPLLMAAAGRSGRYEVQIERDGRPLTVLLAAQPVPPWRSRLDALLRSTVGLAFAALGVAVGLLQPERPAARLYCLAGSATGAFFLRQALLPLRPFFSEAEALGYTLLLAFHPLQFSFGYHFYARFPEGARPGRVASGLVFVLHAWGCGLWLVWCWMAVLLQQGEQHALAVYQRLEPFFAAYRPFLLWFVVGSALSICGVIVRNWRQADSPAERQRVRLVLLGSFLGVLPWGLTQSPLGSLVELRDLLASGAYLFTALIPVTLSYAILKHRVFDIRVLVRRGVRYLLAVNVLRGALAVPAAVLGLRALRHPDWPVSAVFFGEPVYPVLLVLALAGLRYRQRLRDALDRRFFREAHAEEQVLLGLAEEVRRAGDSSDDVARMLAERLAEALHPERVGVFFRRLERSELEPGSSADAAFAGLRLSAEGPLWRLLETSPDALDPRALRESLPEPERRVLLDSGVELLVPLVAGTSGLVGLIALGPRKSEQPYSAHDRRLLRAVAAQAAIALENQLLKERVGRERSIRHDVLAHLKRDGLELLHECPACGRCYPGGERCLEDGAELTLPLPVDFRLDGRYRFERLLGRGGMGAVYAARDERLARDVAVKVLLPRGFGDPLALRRFEREARALARLSHENIVAVYDYGRAGAEGAYLVMERLPGRTLRDELEQRRRLDLACFADWSAQICAGVAAAHAAGIVHRDLKPSNVLLVSRGEATLLKLSDFGVAKLQDGPLDSGTGLTAPGALVGTLAYMAPEQVGGGEVDARADVYALGVLALEMLSGPLERASGTDVLTVLLYGGGQAQGRSTGSAALDAVLARAMAREPGQRHATVPELGAALQAALGDTP